MISFQKQEHNDINFNYYFIIRQNYHLKQILELIIAFDFNTLSRGKPVHN